MDIDVWEVWVFIDRLSDFLDDKALINLSMVNYLLYLYLNENCIWKRKCLKYNIVHGNISWKEAYIKNKQIYVTPISTKKYHIEYRNHLTGCFIRVLSSEHNCLTRKTSYMVSDLDMEYYVIRIDSHNMIASLVLLQTDSGGNKYYTQDKIIKFKLIKQNKLFNIQVYIKRVGLLIMPWSSIQDKMI